MAVLQADPVSGQVHDGSQPSRCLGLYVSASTPDKTSSSYGSSLTHPATKSTASVAAIAGRTRACEPRRRVSEGFFAGPSATRGECLRGVYCLGYAFVQALTDSLSPSPAQPGSLILLLARRTWTTASGRPRTGTQALRTSGPTEHTLNDLPPGNNGERQRLEYDGGGASCLEGRLLDAVKVGGFAVGRGSRCEWAEW